MQVTKVDRALSHFATRICGFPISTFATFSCAMPPSRLESRLQPAFPPKAEHDELTPTSPEAKILRRARKRGRLVVGKSWPEADVEHLRAVDYTVARGPSSGHFRAR
jgi:hypothetical protein